MPARPAPDTSGCQQDCACRAQLPGRGTGCEGHRGPPASPQGAVAEGDQNTSTKDSQHRGSAMAPGFLGTFPVCPVLGPASTGRPHLLWEAPGLVFTPAGLTCSLSPTHLLLSPACRPSSTHSLSASPGCSRQHQPVPHNTLPGIRAGDPAGREGGTARVSTARAALLRLGVSGVKGQGRRQGGASSTCGPAWLLTCSLEAKTDSVSWRAAPGWKGRMSASSCLVLREGDRDGG